MQILTAACLILLLAGSSLQFTNPIALRSGDPWLVYYNDYFHLTHSTDTNSAVIRKASTLAGLNSAEETVVFTTIGGHLWAPEVHQVDNKWYLYYSSCNNLSSVDESCHRNRVAESKSDDPMGPYEHKADLGDFYAIDPSLIWINSKYYLLGAYPNEAQSLYIRELTNAYTLAPGSEQLLSRPTYDWEMSGSPVNEAPEPLYHGNRTFIVYSACHCKTADYKLGLLEFIGTEPLDATHWKKYPNPVFQRDDDHSVYGPGHNGFFKSPDSKEDWIVYHAKDSSEESCDFSRSSRAQKFTWGADGLPIFGEPDAPGDELEEPSGE